MTSGYRELIIDHVTTFINRFLKAIEVADKFAKEDK